MILPPGTILQHLYFKERLRLRNPGRFIEIGVGQGVLSKVLLDQGWSGRGYELNPHSVQVALQTNRTAVDAGRYEIKNTDWLGSKDSFKADMVVSSMVLEHLNERDEARYFRKVRRVLRPGGVMTLLVPSCPDYWGVDDEIAGHYRRYTFRDMEARSKKFGLNVLNMAGLTFPLSNWLYPLSEFLVNRAEGQKRKLSMAQRTQLSGNRDVIFKTNYPWFLGLALNEVMLYPFHWLQKRNTRNERSMILYAELSAS